MKKSGKKIINHIANVVTIALIVECFLCAMMALNMYSERHCFDRIEETAVQSAEMLNHAVTDRGDKLTVFADIIAANSENPEELLEKYMESFCKTQYFAAICIHRYDGTKFSYGEHPHDRLNSYIFDGEVNKLPYISNVFESGEAPNEKFFYQAVPVVREGKTIAILYGYTSLEVLPKLISSNAYDGRCEHYLVDGDTGAFLMREQDSKLNSIYDSELDGYKTKDEYNAEKMREGIENGQSGFYAYRSDRDGEWYYIYYMPLGINNWSMQVRIDESTAFKAYTDVSRTVIALMVAVIVLMVIHVLILMLQSNSASKSDREHLKKTAYINSVQRALMNAHSNPDFVDRALGIIGEEMKAETVLLLTFRDKTVTNAQYWPSKDKAQAMNMLGRNIRDDFPALFDMLASDQSIIYDMQSKDASQIELSKTALEVFIAFDVSNIALAPITDNSGILIGALAAVNMAEVKSAEMLECVNYDFFMAIANLENHNIIKNMGAVDYLTGVKNRNSYESELEIYKDSECGSIWCMFIDVNGLHEVNNTKGHKAGDIMLTAVAAAIKRAFGDKYAYRLGGDEFAAFAHDSTKEEMLKKKRAINKELSAKGYAVSIGFEGAVRIPDLSDIKVIDPDGTPVSGSALKHSRKGEETGAAITVFGDEQFDIERIVSAAEEIMYREKLEYYKKNNISPDRANAPARSFKNEEKKDGEGDEGGLPED